MPHWTRLLREIFRKKDHTEILFEHFMKNKRNILQIYLGNQMIYVTGKIEDAKIVKFNNSKCKAMSIILKGVKSLKPITSEEYETFSQRGLLNPNLSVNLLEGVYIYKIFDEISEL